MATRQNKEPMHYQNIGRDNRNLSIVAHSHNKENNLNDDMALLMTPERPKEKKN